MYSKSNTNWKRRDIATNKTMTMNFISQPPPSDDKININDMYATKAVVIMYGWLGSVEKHLKKYAELYANHPLQKCSVVYGTAGIATIIFRHDAELFGKEICWNYSTNWE